MCSVDLRPFDMSATPAFKWYLGGFSQSYVQETIHPNTIAVVLSYQAEVAEFPRVVLLSFSPS